MKCKKIECNFTLILVKLVRTSGEIKEKVRFMMPTIAVIFMASKYLFYLSWILYACNKAYFSLLTHMSA